MKRNWICTMPETSAHSFRRFINTTGSGTPQWYCKYYRGVLPQGLLIFPESTLGKKTPRYLTYGI
jgi:hypothetical protein